MNDVLSDHSATELPRKPESEIPLENSDGIQKVFITTVHNATKEAARTIILQNNEVQYADSPDEKNATKKERVALGAEEALLLYEADYGFLPSAHPVVRLARESLERLSPGIPKKDLPRIEVLASKGEGVNAAAFANNVIVVTPELIEFIEYEEELDGVLLHELHHLWQGHMEKENEDETEKEHIGALRFQEYDADMRAFYDAADPIRKTSPLGLITFLERLRESEADRRKVGTMEWGIIHGDTTDRILNLKTTLRFLDLLDLGQNNHSLTQMPQNLCDSVSQLPIGKNLATLLRKPPSDTRNWEKWDKEMRSIVDSANWNMCQIAIKELGTKIHELERSVQQDKKLQRTNAAEATRETAENYTVLLRYTLKRWKMLFDEKYSVLDEEGKEKMMALLLEAGTNLHVHSAPENPLWKKVGLGGVGATTREWKNDETYLQELKVFIEKVSSPVLRGQIMNMIAVAANHSIGSAAAFDDEDGLRTKDFLEQAIALLRSGKAMEDTHGMGSPHRTSLTLEDGWDEAIASVLVTLADQGIKGAHLATMIKELAINSALPQGISAKRIIDLLRTYNETELFQPLQGLVEVNNEIILGDFVNEEETLKELCSVFHAVQKRRERNINLDSFDLKANKERHNSRATRKFYVYGDDEETEEKKTQKSIAAILESRREPIDLQEKENINDLAKLASIVRRLPETLPPEFIQSVWPHLSMNKFGKKVMTSTFLESLIADLFTGKNLSSGSTIDDEKYSVMRSTLVDQWQLSVPWIYAAARDKNEYKNWLLENFEPAEFKNYQDLMECRRRIDSPHFPPWVREKEFACSSEFLQESKWKNAALHMFSKEVEKTSGAEEFFASIDDFLAAWPVNQIDPFLSNARAAIVVKGLGFINVNQLVTNGLDRERLLKLTFFISDGTVRAPLQDFLLMQDLKSLNFTEALNKLFHQYKIQGGFSATQCLEYLTEDRARTPSEIEESRDHSFKKASAQLSSNNIGNVVATEGLWQTVFKRSNRKEILQALLTTQKDEHALQKVLFAGWRKKYDSVLKIFCNRLEHALGADDLSEHLNKTTGLQSKSGIILIDNPELFEGSSSYEDELPVVPLETTRALLYRLGTMERHVLLRQLLNGNKGVLATTEGRTQMLDDLFAAYVQTGTDENLTVLLKEIFGSFITASPIDELFIMIEPLLRSRIAVSPVKRNNWHAFAAKIATDSIPGRYEIELDDCMASKPDDFVQLSKDYPFYEKCLGNATKMLPGLKWIEATLEQEAKFLMDPSDYRKSVDDLDYNVQLTSVIPKEFLPKEANVLQPIELILEVAKQLGAPGVRFLQLLGQTVEIPAQYRTKFLEVYDSIKGQSKIAAWETIRRETPDYAKKVVSLNKRIGGGSLYTVYDTETSDTEVPRDVTKVLNPNALYHAESAIKIMRDALSTLAEKKQGKFSQALPLLEVIREWIVTELHDENFEENDKVFAKKWEGWRPNRAFSARINIPKSRPTGTPKVRRDEFVDGENLTLLNEHSPKEQKEIIALAVQHYVSQLGGKMEFLMQEKVLVHSDISMGNLRYNKQNKRLSILDRSMYLEFSREDRRFLQDLAKANDTSQLASTMTEWLWEVPENKEATPALEKKTMIDAIAKRIQSKDSNKETAAMDAMIVIHEHGLRVPLRFMLLFKNINALRQMALLAGFTSFEEAAQYRP